MRKKNKQGAIRDLHGIVKQKKVCVSNNAWIARARFTLLLKIHNWRISETIAFSLLKWSHGRKRSPREGKRRRWWLGKMWSAQAEGAEAEEDALLALKNWVERSGSQGCLLIPSLFIVKRLQFGFQTFFFSRKEIWVTLCFIFLSIFLIPEFFLKSTEPEALLKSHADMWQVSSAM